MIAEKIGNVGKILLNLSKDKNNQHIVKLLERAGYELLDASDTARNLENSLVIPQKSREARDV